MTDTEAKAPTDTLIARLESADGPSYVLDCAIGEYIAKATGAPYLVPPKPYTASIDAALTLVPEGWDWELYPREAGLIHPDSPGVDVFADAATPALALAAAALKARGV